MLVADTYVGNLDDPEVAEQVEETEPLRIEVDDTERRRSRFRTTTEDGREVGVVVTRDLQDGDVLSADETLVVVRLEPVEAMVLDVADADVTATTAIEVGHAVGNRHWNLVVRDEEVLLPVAEGRDRMEAAVEPLVRAGVEVRFADVSPATFDGVGGPTGHDHGHGAGHDHGGGDHAHVREGHAHDLHRIPTRSADE